MKTKLLEQLKTKCKDFGLTKKALEELAEIGAAGLKDESTDEEVAAEADKLVPFAKTMQGEITRKTKKSSAKQSEKSSEDEGEEGNGEGKTDEAPEWAKSMLSRLDALEKENTTLKAEKQAAERASVIADKAKQLGIPDFMAKRLNIADDADIDAELASFKQDLVSNSLMPKGQAHEAGKLDLTQAKEDAKSWAAGLPD